MAIEKIKKKKKQKNKKEKNFQALAIEATVDGENDC